MKKKSVKNNGGKKGFFSKSMELDVSKKGIRMVRGVVLILIGILLIGAIYANFIYYKECENTQCFNDYLSECSRAEFISDKEMVFDYKIKGRWGDDCVVKVELLEAKDLNQRDSSKVEGEKMVCKIPVGVITVPESDLNLCSGELKEGFQDLFISKLHRYIVQNLGEINEDLLGL